MKNSSILSNAYLSLFSIVDECLTDGSFNLSETIVPAENVGVCTLQVSDSFAQAQRRVKRLSLHQAIVDFKEVHLIREEESVCEVRELALEEVIALPHCHK